jgi:PBP1b-binding outer membrane lipoprotein LpoB
MPGNYRTLPGGWRLFFLLKQEQDCFLCTWPSELNSRRKLRIMKHLLIITIAAVLLAGCGESQQSAPPAETQAAEPVAEVPAQPLPPPVESKPAETQAVEPAKPTTPPKAVSANKGADPARGINPEPLIAKAPDISIHEAVAAGNIEVVKQHLAAGVDVNALSVNGKTPLDWANDEITELLRKHGGKTGEELKAEGK